MAELVIVPTLIIYLGLSSHIWVPIRCAQSFYHLYILVKIIGSYNNIIIFENYILETGIIYTFIEGLRF